MEEPPPKSPNVAEGFSLLNEDLLQNILSKLPAVTFASAAQVSTSWNRVCNRVLCRPKFASAISLNTSLQDAVTEVVDKVLSEPIRPHFAIACAGLEFDLKDVHGRIRKKLGSNTPIITSATRGIIGNDALSNEFKEVKWVNLDNDTNPEAQDLPENMYRGVVLIVGFVPGMKVDAIPLSRTKEHPHGSMVDKFVMDIRDFSASASGRTSPSAIVMFGDQHADMQPIFDKMNYGLSKETVVVGDECCSFLYGSNAFDKDAIALVFARDSGKPQGVGETHFHVTLSSGVTPVGPIHKAVSVRVKGVRPERSTWLTARREGSQEILDGQSILDNIDDEMENHIASQDLYIAVTKRRKCGIGQQKVRTVTSLAFHAVLGGDEEYLFVDGIGIKTGDPFRFYHSDPNAAISSLRTVSEEFSILKEKWTCTNCVPVAGIDIGDKKDVCGGMIFSCYGRGDSFFGQSNVDSTPFLENFSGVPFAGIYCGGEIGRRCPSSRLQEGEEQNSIDRCLHVYSTVYLVISYSSGA